MTVAPCIIVPRAEVEAYGDAYVYGVIDRMFDMFDESEIWGSERCGAMPYIVGWRLDDDGGDVVTLELSMLDPGDETT